MSDIICVTSRKLCTEDFLVRIGKIAEAEPEFIILREKDLTEVDYIDLAKKAIEICKGKTELILHYYWKAALDLGTDRIHLPLNILREMGSAKRKRFSRIGVSCHSSEEAAEAESLGADYITAGHVFATDCKQGLAPRGLDFLREVVGRVHIPVYAIGGISPDNIRAVRSCGAAGACVMSGFMKCAEPSAFISEFYRK